MPLVPKQAPHLFTCLVSLVLLLLRLLLVLFQVP